MKRYAAVLIAIAWCTGVGVSAVGAEKEKPRLTVKQDGDTIVVSTSIEIDDTPLVLWTHAVVHSNEIDMGPPVGVAGYVGRPEVELFYYVIQNRDDPGLWDATKRKTRQLPITWRLEDPHLADPIYTVVRDFRPSIKELKGLLPQLQQLVEKGERRMQSKIGIP